MSGPDLPVVLRINSADARDVTLSEVGALVAMDTSSSVFYIGDRFETERAAAIAFAGPRPDSIFWDREAFYEPHKQVSEMTTPSQYDAYNSEMGGTLPYTIFTNVLVHEEVKKVGAFCLITDGEIAPEDVTTCMKYGVNTLAAMPLSVGIVVGDLSRSPSEVEVSVLASLVAACPNFLGLYSCAPGMAYVLFTAGSVATTYPPPEITPATRWSDLRCVPYAEILGALTIKIVKPPKGYSLLEVRGDEHVFFNYQKMIQRPVLDYPFDILATLPFRRLALTSGFRLDTERFRDWLRPLAVKIREEMDAALSAPTPSGIRLSEIVAQIVELRQREGEEATVQLAELTALVPHLRAQAFSEVRERRKDTLARTEATRSLLREATNALSVVDSAGPASLTAGGLGRGRHENLPLVSEDPIPETLLAKCNLGEGSPILCDCDICCARLPPAILLNRCGLTSKAGFFDNHPFALGSSMKTFPVAPVRICTECAAFLVENKQAMFEKVPVAYVPVVAPPDAAAAAWMTRMLQRCLFGPKARDNAHIMMLSLLDGAERSTWATEGSLGEAVAFLKAQLLTQFPTLDGIIEGAPQPSLQVVLKGFVESQSFLMSPIEGALLLLRLGRAQFPPNFALKRAACSIVTNTVHRFLKVLREPADFAALKQVANRERVSLFTTLFGNPFAGAASEAAPQSVGGLLAAAHFGEVASAVIKRELARFLKEYGVEEASVLPPLLISVFLALLMKLCVGVVGGGAQLPRMTSLISRWRERYPVVNGMFTLDALPPDTGLNEALRGVVNEIGTSSVHTCDDAHALVPHYALSLGAQSGPSSLRCVCGAAFLDASVVGHATSLSQLVQNVEKNRRRHFSEAYGTLYPSVRSHHVPCHRIVASLGLLRGGAVTREELVKALEKAYELGSGNIFHPRLPEIMLKVLHSWKSFAGAPQDARAAELGYTEEASFGHVPWLACKVRLELEHAGVVFGGGSSSLNPSCTVTREDLARLHAEPAPLPPGAAALLDGIHPLNLLPRADTQ